MQQSTQTQLKQSTQQNPFLLYPEVILKADLTQSQRAILAAIITHCRKTKSSECKLYNRRLAEMSGCTQKTVADILPALKRKGCIAIHGFLRGRVIELLQDFTGEQFLKVPIIHAKPAARLVLAYVQSLESSYRLVFPSNATGGARCAMSARSFSQQIGKLKKSGLLNSKTFYDRNTLHWRRYLRTNAEAIAQAVIHSVKSILATSQVHTEQSKAKHTSKYEPVFTAYRQACGELIKAHKIKAPPVVDMRRTAKQVKYLANEYGVDVVADCVHKAAGDWWIVSHGFALSTILANRVFNRLLNGRVSAQGSPEFSPILAAYQQEAEMLVKAGRLTKSPSIPKNISELARPLVNSYGVETVVKCIHTAAGRSWIVNGGYRPETILNSQAFSLLLPSEADNE